MPWVGCSGNLSSGAQSCGTTSSGTEHHGALHSEVQCRGAMLQERQWDCSEQPESSHRAPQGFLQLSPHCQSTRSTFRGWPCSVLQVIVVVKPMSWTSLWASRQGEQQSLDL